MEEENDVQALEKISSEVDESQIKVILSSQCIKAQAFLLDKLKKQSERHQETCSFISSANLKLEAEIIQAEQEISSMLIAQETIKSANVEIRKEWLVAKVRKTDITERIEEGKKRYESLWLDCKTRFESIPFVQKLLRTTENAQSLNNDIDALDKQIAKLYEEMKNRRKICFDLDRKRAIELANYMVFELQNTKKIITEKSEDIKNITKQIEGMLKEKNTTTCDAAAIKSVVEPQTLDTNEKKDDVIVKNDDLNKSDDDGLLPKLELENFDLDIIDANLERVKTRKDEILNTLPMTDSIHNFEENKTEKYQEGSKPYEYLISPYFNTYKENESRNFSKRKLINILEDIHINNNDAYNIVKKVNPDNLRTVNEIASDAVKAVREPQTFSKEKACYKNTPIESDTIEEVDMTCSNADNIIIPPTQFLDITLPGSQDGSTKKRVSFELPSSLKVNEIIEDEKMDGNKQNDNEDIETANQTMSSQLDVSVASEDSFMKIKDMILKKHNLDLSPQFEYAKNPLQNVKQRDENIVTSKFFQNDNQEANTDEPPDNRMEMDEEQNVPEPENNLEHKNSEEQNLKDNAMPMDVDEMIVSSPKQNKKHEEKRSEKPISGLLFTHGTQGIPDSLNASMSTTGYEDSDFPQCIDSSLLLSPKADVPMAGDNPDVLSQDVPNFLTGFRKTGLSFFGGGSATSEPKPDSSGPNDGNTFSFNFGGEKKNRGGLFSLFN